MKTFRRAFVPVAAYALLASCSQNPAASRAGVSAAAKAGEDGNIAHFDYERLCQLAAGEVMGVTPDAGPQLKARVTAVDCPRVLYTSDNVQAGTLAAEAQLVLEGYGRFRIRARNGMPSTEVLPGL